MATNASALTIDSIHSTGEAISTRRLNSFAAPQPQGRAPQSPAVQQVELNLSQEQVMAATEALFEQIGGLTQNHLQAPIEQLLRDQNIELSAMPFFESVKQAAKAAEQSLDVDELVELETGDCEASSLEAANLASRAEYLYQNELKKMEQRLRWLAKQGMPIASQAWAPEGIAAAFASLISGHANSSDVFPEFEAKIVPLFDGFYRDVNQELEQTCSRVDGMAAAGQEQQQVLIAKAQPNVAQPQAAPQPSSNTLAETPDLSAALTAVSRFKEAGVNNRSAQGLSKSMGLPTTEMTVVEAPSVAHHLLGILIRQMVDDACMAKACRPLIESLRPALRCAALRDPRFFSDAQHPIRCLMADIAQMACATHDPESEKFKKLEGFVNRVRDKLTGSGAPNPLPSLNLDDDAIERFTIEERQRRRDRRRVITESARDTVAHSVEEATYGRKMPEAVRQLISKGIAPMLVMRYVRTGSTSLQWNEGLRLLNALVASVDPATADMTNREQRSRAMKLVDQLGEALDSAGLSAQQARLLINRLQAIYDGMAAQALMAKSSAPKAEKKVETEGKPEGATVKKVSIFERKRQLVSALSVLLRYGSWFKVFDKNSGKARWLKVSGFDADKVSVSFSQFSGDSMLNMSAWKFAEELVDGRSAPVNPDAGTREVIGQLAQGFKDGVIA